MSYVTIASERLRQKEYNATIRRIDDHDAFSESSSLSFDDARTTMKDLHHNVPKVVVIYGAPAVTAIAVGDTIQLTALMYNQKRFRPVLTPDELGKPVTTTAEWLTDPTPTAVLTVVNGLVTGAVAGTVDVYAKVGDLETERITITVS